MGKVTGFLEFERHDRHYAPVAERIRNYAEFVVPLNEKELREQAAAAAAYIAGIEGISAVISSPLQRALDTAKAAANALGLDVTVDDDLIETDFGAFRLPSLSLQKAMNSASSMPSSS